jgi:secreted trypsin-like serine protease
MLASRVQALQELQVEALPDKVCNEKNVHNGDIREKIMVCAGFLEGGRYACFGDSGGPLVLSVQESNGGFAQIGIAPNFILDQGVYPRTGMGCTFA